MPDRPLRYHWGPFEISSDISGTMTGSRITIKSMLGVCGVGQEPARNKFTKLFRVNLGWPGSMAALENDMFTTAEAARTALTAASKRIVLEDAQVQFSSFQTIIAWASSKGCRKNIDQ